MNAPSHPFLGRQLDGIASPFVLILAWALINLFSSLISGLLPQFDITVIHFGLLLAVGFIVWHRAHEKIPQREQWFSDEPIWQIITLGILVGGIGWAILNFVVQPGVVWCLDLLNIPNPPAQEHIRGGLIQGGLIGLVNIAITVLLVPFAEEVFFRGAFFASTASHLGMQVGLAAQALFFGVVHINPLVVVITTILGLINGWVLGRRLALALPIVIHIVFNLLSVIVVLLQRG